MSTNSEEIVSSLYSQIQVAASTNDFTSSTTSSAIISSSYRTLFDSSDEPSVLTATSKPAFISPATQPTSVSSQAATDFPSVVVSVTIMSSYVFSDADIAHTSLTISSGTTMSDNQERSSSSPEPEATSNDLSMTSGTLQDLDLAVSYTTIRSSTIDSLSSSVSSSDASSSISPEQPVGNLPQTSSDIDKLVSKTKLEEQQTMIVSASNLPGSDIDDIGGASTIDQMMSTLSSQDRPGNQAIPPVTTIATAYAGTTSMQPTTNIFVLSSVLPSSISDVSSSELDTMSTAAMNTLETLTLSGVHISQDLYSAEATKVITKPADTISYSSISQVNTGSETRDSTIADPSATVILVGNAASITSIPIMTESFVSDTDTVAVYTTPVGITITGASPSETTTFSTKPSTTRSDTEKISSGLAMFDDSSIPDLSASAKFFSQEETETAIPIIPAASTDELATRTIPVSGSARNIASATTMAYFTSGTSLFATETTAVMEATNTLFPTQTTYIETAPITRAAYTDGNTLGEDGSFALETDLLSTATGTIVQGTSLLLSDKATIDSDSVAAILTPTSTVPGSSAFEISTGLNTIATAAPIGMIMQSS